MHLNGEGSSPRRRCLKTLSQVRMERCTEHARGMSRLHVSFARSHEVDCRVKAGIVPCQTLSHSTADLVYF